MTQYMMKADKNGKPRYYKLVDGKMKTTSRAEYEANAEVKTEAAEVETQVVEIEVPVIEAAETETEAPAAETEAEEPVTCAALVPTGFWDAGVIHAEPITEKPEDIALSVVKSIVSGMEGKDEGKVKMQTVKRSILINYRNCMVCSLVFDGEHKVTAIRFMGATLETRKKATVCEVKNLSEYTDKIVEQVVFIDWWWANSSKKKAA